MPRSTTVMLGGKTYVVEELRARANADWRKRLAGPFGDIAGKLSAMGMIELSDGQALGDLVRSLSGTLIGSIETIKDLVFSYSPVLRQDEKRLGEEAYDSEFLDAFIEILKLAYPFGSWLGKLMELAALGQQARATSPSSPSASGAAGTTS